MPFAVRNEGLAAVSKLRTDRQNRQIDHAHRKKQNFGPCLPAGKEPKEGTEGGTCPFIFRPQTNPSMLVAAPDIWQASSEIIYFLIKHFEHPRRKLLEDWAKYQKYTL